MRGGTPTFQNRISARLEKSCHLRGQRFTKQTNQKTVETSSTSHPAKVFDAAIRNFPLHMRRLEFL